MLKEALGGLSKRVLQVVIEGEYFSCYVLGK